MENNLRIAYSRKYYLAHKEKIRASCKARTQRLRDIVAKEKSKPCADCGQTFHPICMDMDHVKGKKTLKVSALVEDGVRDEVLFREIAKCDVVCACCHRLRHLKRGTWGHYPKPG